MGSKLMCETGGQLQAQKGEGGGGSFGNVLIMCTLTINKMKD